MKNGFPRLLVQARNDKVSDSRSNYRPPLSLRASDHTGVAISRFFRHFSLEIVTFYHSTGGLPGGELPRRGKRGHPGVRRFAARNDRGGLKRVLLVELGYHPTLQ